VPQDRPGDDEVGQGPPRGNSWRPDGAFQKRRRGESVGLGLDQAHAVPGGMRAAGWVRRVLRGVDASNAQPTAARSVRDLLARRDPKAAAQRDFSSTCTNRRIARRIPARVRDPGSRSGDMDASASRRRVRSRRSTMAARLDAARRLLWCNRGGAHPRDRIPRVAHGRGEIRSELTSAATRSYVASTTRADRTDLVNPLRRLAVFVELTAVGVEPRSRWLAARRVHSGHGSSSQRTTCEAPRTGCHTGEARS
jgi:hypothetical protein